MRLIYLEPRDITDDDREAFWDQDVDMDDWDYIILAPPESIAEIADEGEGHCREPDLFESGLSHLLHGSYKNRWYYANYRGRNFAVGIAYHG